MEKDILKVLVTEEQIQARIKEMGREISEEYKDKDPVVLGVLKGVVMFYADMMKHITVPCQMDFMCLSSYRGGTSTGNMIVKQDMSVDVSGRHVLILEDIYDTGKSLQYTYNHLMSKNPASVKICTLLDKPERRFPHITLQPDWVGFTIPNEFVVGYGLDFAEHYRNLPYVGVLKPEAYEK